MTRDVGQKSEYARLLNISREKPGGKDKVAGKST
jgi:hypothetical protein